ncbi:ThuA domain-containing protein [Sphingomonas profundi]|uniref:ThuA domain-containing protein n=1 Tax=Alterirhizorhabdus profundi TaxID=2681549 RepID=UPI0012E8140A|nr:ThuA domain-containing protein [Sphingomonas profundi]
MHETRHVHLIVAGRYHDMDYARLELLKLLAETPSVRTVVDGDFHRVGRLPACDLLVTYTCDIAPAAAEVQALHGFLQAGGRWLALHGTNAILRFLDDGRIAASDAHDDYMDVIGTKFLGHPPIGPFRVENAAPDHPLVAGIAPFDIVDELYLFERRGALTPLLTATFSGSIAPFAAADWQDEASPIFYHREVGAGGILYLALGHCRSHYDPSPNGAFIPHPVRCGWDYPVFHELLRRSLRWGMGL